MHPPRRAARSGFTLIEMLVVMAIIAVLAAIALPTYQDYIRRSHRAEARSGLLQAAHWLERVATATGVYPVSTTEASALPATLATVPGQRYAISLTASTQSAYTLSAEPRGAQAGDRCGTLLLDNAGVRNVSLAGQAGNAALVAECWGR